MKILRIAILGIVIISFICYNRINNYAKVLMKKKLLLLGIHLTVVALVLILTMVTLAWYTKNETAETSNAVIVAEPIDDMGITDIVDNIVPYKGQTGLGGEDAPYVATKIIYISQESQRSTDAVTCELTNLKVKLANGTIIDSSTSGFENMRDFFTLRVKVVTLGENNTVNEIKGVFFPNEDGILQYYDEDEEEMVNLNYQDENFFTVTSNGALSLKKTCTTYFQLELIFLDENSYSIYTSANNVEQMFPFKFSDLEYMGSTFYSTFKLGLEEVSIFS